MASMYEIAREAGVSASTAARALRGTGYCSPESKEKVLAAAKRLGYIPSHAARSLKLKRTQKILFCIPDIYKERRMNIPDDMAIIGMDNSDLAAILGLSSIRMQEEEIGRQAATMLMERILRKRQDKRTIRLLPELVLRASTGINVKNVTLPNQS